MSPLESTPADPSQNTEGLNLNSTDNTMMAHSNFLSNFEESSTTTPVEDLTTDGASTSSTSNKRLHANPHWSLSAWRIQYDDLKLPVINKMYWTQPCEPIRNDIFATPKFKPNIGGFAANALWMKLKHPVFLAFYLTDMFNKNGRFKH